MHKRTEISDSSTENFTEKFRKIVIEKMRITLVKKLSKKKDKNEINRAEPVINFV